MRSVRPKQETNTINRVLKARGMGTLEEPGTLAQLAYMVEDHQHFTELLRACEPTLRREMYEAMVPHLRFPAKPLESYIIAAKEHAGAAELPVLDEDGMLHSYMPPYVGTVAAVVELPPAEFWIRCSRCTGEAIFFGEHKGAAVQHMRNAGWAFDESTHGKHLCPQCLDQVPDSVD